MIFLYSSNLLLIRQKPGMAFEPPFFPALWNYINGVQDCCRHGRMDQPVCEELESFTTWIPKQLDVPLPPFGWMQIIRERARRDCDRVRLFVDLFLQHRQE